MATLQRLVISATLSTVLFMVLAATQVAAQTRAAARKPMPRALLSLERDYLAPVVGSDAPLTPGVRVEIVLLTGKRSEPSEITKVDAGKDNRSLQAVTVKSGSRTQKLQAAAIALFIVDGSHTYHVLLDSEKKTYVLLDEARRDQVVSERLKAKRQMLWKELSEADQQAAVAEEKQHLQEVAAAFPQRNFTLHETDYFLFYTDIPANQVGVYIANLDAMYAELCRLFGFPPQTNIWRGKCSVVAFLQREEFVNYEAKFQNDTETEGRPGKCHLRSDGRVIIACQRGNDPAFFGALLVHETSHGFLHRFRSNVHILPWINEGIADWVAGVVVPACPETTRRQKEAVQRMAASGSMEGLYNAQGPTFRRVHYGIASSLTHYLIQQDATRYRGLLTAIKEGADWQDALREVYGVTPEELAQSYGRSVGVANLGP